MLLWLYFPTLSCCCHFIFPLSHAAVTLFSRSLMLLWLYFPTLSCCCPFIFPLSHAAVTLFSHSLMLMSLDKRNKESLVSTFFFSGIWTGYNQERKRERATEGETERERDWGGDRESERESVEESNQAERKSMENLILGITTQFERK